MQNQSTKQTAQNSKDVNSKCSKGIQPKTVAASLLSKLFYFYLYSLL